MTEVKTTKSKKTKELTQKTVKLISYAIKMTIPTGQYANIQPEIVVQADTLEEAEKAVMPYMDKLWREYYMVSERPKPAMKPVPNPSIPISDAPVVLPIVEPVLGPVDEPLPFVASEPSAIASVAMTKAINAINSCMSAEALKMIKDQIRNSEKLNENEKKELEPIAAHKYIELSTPYDSSNPS